MFFALIFGFPIAFITFHYAKQWLDTPGPANAFGAFLVWAAVFMFGGVIEAAPETSKFGTVTAEEAFISTLKFLGFAVFNYAAIYLLQRTLARREARNNQVTSTEGQSHHELR